MTNRMLDLALSLFLLLFGGWVAVGAWGLGIWSPVGPASGLFPLAAGLLISVLSLANVIRWAMRQEILLGTLVWGEIAPIVAVIALIGVYLWVVPYGGMFMPLPLFLVLLSLCVSWRTDGRWLAGLAGGAVVFSVICFFVFKQFLDMLVPEGPLGF